MNWVPLILAVASLAVVLLYAVMGRIARHRLKRLQELRNLPTPVGSVAIIVPARNEQKHIEAAVSSLLRQDYSRLEVIAVNDRSTDDTGAILDRIAQEETRLRVVHITSLPTGWLGKNHALHTAAAQTTSDLLLFADADVVMHADTVARAVAYLEQEGLDHLTMTPDVEMPSFWLDAFVVAFSMYFLAYFQPWRARDPKSSCYVGIGAFNLIRREVYQKIGGHEPLRMRPDDDMKLGKLIKRAGFAQELLIGKGALMVPWYGSLRELIQGMEKNAFAGVDYSVATIVVSSIAAVVLNVWPFVAIWMTSGWTRWLNLSIVAVILYSAVQAAREVGRSWWCALAFPLTTFLFIFIQWRTMIINLRDDGLNWRGTHYSLKELRANRV